jgi:hypothetical protein
MNNVWQQVLVWYKQPQTKSLKLLLDCDQFLLALHTNKARRILLDFRFIIVASLRGFCWPLGNNNNNNNNNNKVYYFYMSIFER